jgi:hypothetical protein
MTPSAIRRRAKKEGWPLRPGARGGRRTSRDGNEDGQRGPDCRNASGAKTPARAGAELAAREKRLLEPEPLTDSERRQRALGLVELHLRNLEMLMIKEGLTTVQDGERMTRAVSGTLESLEKVREMDPELDKSRAAGAASPTRSPEDTERLRREIAERLERLNAEWLAQSKSQ